MEGVVKEEVYPLSKAGLLLIMEEEEQEEETQAPMPSRAWRHCCRCRASACIPGSRTCNTAWS